MGKATVDRLPTGGVPKIYHRFSATRYGSLKADTVALPAFDETFPAGTVYIVVGMYVWQMEEPLPATPEEVDTAVAWSKESPIEFHIFIHPDSGAVTRYDMGRSNSRGDKYFSMEKYIPYTVTINADGTLRVVLAKDNVFSWYNGQGGYRYAEFTYCVMG